MTSRFVRRARSVTLLVSTLLAGFALSAGAEDQAKPVEIKGWIVDEICGRANANPNGKACTLRCQAEGAKLVLFEEEEGLILALSDQAKAEAHIGYVKVTGTLDGKTIEVADIEDLEHRARDEDEGH